ncbi:MAG: ATP-dependent DNA helicase [Burkholderiaceae bacterium]
MLSEAVRQVLSDQGPFARRGGGFVERAGQLDMSEAVVDALERRQILVVEAGTGTGKTFAYLVPALLAHHRVLISTGSRTLQDQLFHRDLPAVMAALGVAPRTALLKGRGNYVCHHHLERNLAQGRFESRRDIATLQRISRFAALSESGDLSEAEGVGDESPVWRMASSTRENCLGQDCEFLDKCFVYRARRKAMTADVVVVNHHLFCADLAMRDEGVSELLPQTQAVIFDEAHQLPDVATSFFGQALSGRQLLDFARDLMRVGRDDAPESADWIELAQGLEQALREARLAGGQAGRRDEPALRSPASRGLIDAVLALDAPVTQCIGALGAAAERSRDLQRLHERGLGLRRRLRQWLQRIDGERDWPFAEDAEIDPVHADDSAWPEHEPERACAGERSELGAGASTRPLEAGPTVDPARTGPADPDRSESGAGDASDDAADPAALVANAGPNAQEIGLEPDQVVAWAEIHRQGLTLHLTPIELGPLFRRQIEARPMAWIFTSATLAAADGFGHFVHSLGLDGARCLAVPSPFDYEHQALLYVPPVLPLPREPGFSGALAEAIAPLLRENGGRAFLLCTTLRMVRELADALASRFAGLDPALDWLVQGEQSRAVLLEQFRSRQRPVLIGSASFWEGVDVVGPQLSIVVIDKLPFAPPDDPVLRARADAMRRRGGDPFREMHLPGAAMALKQGAGRLIRGEHDHGLLVVGDVRLAEKAYGRKLLKSLPPFARTRDPQAAAAFVSMMQALAVPE